MKRLMLCILVLLSLALLACSKGVVCPDGTTAASAAACRNAEAGQDDAMDDASPAGGRDEPAVLTRPRDPKIQAMIDKAESGLKSMAFVYAPVTMTASGPVVIDSHAYRFKGLKARVDINQPPRIDPTTYVEVVYLDYATSSAVGFCNNLKTSICSSRGRRTVAFADFAIKQPQEWLPEIPSDASIKGPWTFFNRETTIVRFVKDGKYYEYYLDNFSGVPLKVAIYKNADYTGLIDGVEYHEPTFNSVKDSDLEPPQ